MTRADRLLGAGCAALALLFYLRTMAPGLTWAHHGADGGDLAAAIISGGIPHPPGYPTYVLLGRLFAAVPHADVAWRLNLLSVVCAAATVGVACGLARRVAAQDGAPDAAGSVRAAATVAALAFAVSPVFWSQALITEVYALHMLFVAALLYAAARGRARQPWFWLVFGLGLGNHLTLLLLAPSLWLLGRRSADISSPGHKGKRGSADGLLDLAPKLPCLLAFLLGLSVYLYLPLRAAAQPPVNWGDPQTLERFLWMVTAAPYHGYAFGLPLAELPARLAAWAALLAQQFSWAGMALALVGLWDLLSLRDRRWGWATLAAVAAYSVYALFYRTADSYVYMLPAYLAIALWLARGALLFIAAARARAGRLAPLAGALLLALPLYQAYAAWPQIDASRDDAERSYVQSVFSDLPARALVISTSDEHTFALWYGQAVAARADVVIVDRDLAQFDWYRRQIEQRLPGVAWQPDGDSPASYTARLARRAASSRPVFLSGDDPALHGAFAWRARGTLWELVAE